MKLVLLILSTLASTAMALESGDTLRCYDKVSSELFLVRIVDAGDETAWVRVFGSKPRFYPIRNVSLEENDKTIEILMLSKFGKTMLESIEVPSTIKRGDSVSGTYADRGDSRGLECQVY